MTRKLQLNRPIYGKVCGYCKDEFQTNVREQTYCSRRCSLYGQPRWSEYALLRARSPEARAKKSKAMSGANNPMSGRTGEANPAYKNGAYVGTDRYRSFNTGVCADCRATSQTNGRRLSVHHADSNHYNNDPANLVTLCQRCHTKRHWAEGGYKDRPTRPARGKSEETKAKGRAYGRSRQHAYGVVARRHPEEHRAAFAHAMDEAGRPSYATNEYARAQAKAYRAVAALFPDEFQEARRAALEAQSDAPAIAGGTSAGVVPVTITW